MKRIAITVSVLTFFAMALVGMTMGQEPFICAIRALIGAVVSYVVAGVAIRLALDVMIKAVVGEGNTPADEMAEEEHSESEG